MNVNKVNLPFNNTGVLSDVNITYHQNSVFEATDNVQDRSILKTKLEISAQPYAIYDEGVFLFSGGFGLSGYTNGVLWANAQATSLRIINYTAGRVNDDPDNKLNVVYTIGSTDAPFGYSWQRWRDAVELGADFYDGDADGIYDPIDKNWNGIWDSNEDMPDLLGDQTAWCIYNDGVPASLRERFTGIEPQGIEILQTLFASDKAGLENMIFIRYKIINRGTVTNVLDSVIFSFWADPDLGNYNDDLVGYDTLLNSFFTYNDSLDAVYGDNSPAYFITLLQGPKSATNNMNNIAYDRRGSLLGADEFYGFENLNPSSFSQVISFDPILWDEDEFSFRFRMMGLNHIGERLDPCTFSIGEIRGGIDCNAVNPLFWYSGDPVEDVGWINIRPTDQRGLLNVGEFTLEKDKPVTIIGAYVLGRGTDALNSITVARENVRRAIEEYNNNFISLAYNPGKPNFPVTDYILHQNYPNPFNPTTTIRYEIPEDGIVTIKIYDILGQKVTTLLNEFKKADRYEVKFSASGLATGVYIYRIKVNDFIESKKMILLR